MTPEISVSDLQRELGSDHPPTVIDVREGDELEISRLPHFLHIPMMDVPSRIGELDREADYAILCRSGSRSARVTAFMIQAGFKHVRNVAGGINEWSRLVDPTLPRY